MIIAIDAGHYNDTPGKRCMKSIDPKETRERHLNARMAEHVEELLLKGYECEVLRVDDRTGKTDPSLAERAARANRAGATAFVSIHHNAGINGGSGGGICVYTTRNADAKRLEFQKAVYDETVKLTGLKGNRATPLPVENHTVTYNAKMPAILGEFGFMDSKTDVPIILTDEFSRKCAQGIVNALVRVFKINKKEIKKMDKFSDIENSGYKDYINRAAELGLMQGFEDGTFRPNEPVTRGMLAAVAVRLKEVKEEK